MKVALVHYWLTGMRGGEKVLEGLCEMFPDADIYTHILVRERLSEALRKRNIQTTFIDKLPLSRRYYQAYLPLMPLALEQLDLTSYDLIISSESGPAKGIIPRPDALHVCYCHTPMRYIWDMYSTYRKNAGLMARIAMPLLSHYLRGWDALSSNRVDHFIANSKFVAARIEKYYRREATVIHPPVETKRFQPSNSHQGYYLLAGQLTEYKKPDLAVEAFNKIGYQLYVIGDGEMFERLKQQAMPNIRMMGRVDDEELVKAYRNCRALVFPGIEDFGITPVEAMASGKPVIAYHKGGVAETVVENKTGIFFEEQTVDSLLLAIKLFEEREHQFDVHGIRMHAEQYDCAQFKKQMSVVLDGKLGKGIDAFVPKDTKRLA